MSTEALLEDLGHAVRVASSGAKALELLRTHADIDLVVTDQAMPGMTGLELADHIRARWPGMPILLATGYGDGRTAAENLPWITKLYCREDLANAIRELVGEDAPFPRDAAPLQRGA